MTVAQGIAKRVTLVKQSGLGVPGSTGGQALRRTSIIFKADRDTFDNPEIVTHQQSTGVSYGLKKISGKMDGVLTPSTYKLPMAAALRADFAATTPISGAGLTIAVSGSLWTVTRSAGSYLTDGIKAGDVVRLSVGTLNAANINKNILIVALTATIATVIPLNDVALVAEGPITGCTVTVIGKKSKTPLTGHTNDYFSYEDFYSDVTRSELFTDVKFGKIDITLPNSGNATFSADAVGIARALSGAQVLTSPTAETTTGVCTSVNGAVFVNGAAVGNCTAVSLAIDGNVKQGDAVLGQNTSTDVSRGRVKVTGSFTALFDSATISTLYDTETPVSLMAVAAVDQTATSDFLGFTVGRMKLLGDAPNDGEVQIARVYPFEAEININGGAALAFDQTILTIQDSAA